VQKNRKLFRENSRIFGVVEVKYATGIFMGTKEVAAATKNYTKQAKIAHFSYVQGMETLFACMTGLSGWQIQ